MIFLGRDIGKQKDYSEHVGELIDDEPRRIIDEAYARATSILDQHRELLDRLARELIGKESLDAQPWSTSSRWVSRTPPRWHHPGC